MAAPMVLKDKLSLENLTDIQKSVSKFLNETLKEDSKNIASPATGGQYKVCVIENGQIKLADEVTEGSQPEPLERKEALPNPTQAKPAENRTEPDPTDEDEEYTPTDRDKLDFDVLGNLLDYYRKFNERQLGLKLDSGVPSYQKSDESANPVICGDVITEAVARVSAESAADQLIAEPTVEPPSDDPRQPFDDYAMHCRIPPEEEKDDSDEECEEDAVSCVSEAVSESNANCMERTLQKSIDEQSRTKNSYDKWGKKDIVKLVTILSERRQEPVRKVPDEWNFREVHTQICMDDIVNKLEEVREPCPLSLFERLKQPSAKNIRGELDGFLADNSDPNVTDKIIHSKYNVYHGGDELDGLKKLGSSLSLMGVGWIKKGYQTVTGIWGKTNGRGANGGIAGGCEDWSYNRWKSWKYLSGGLESLKNAFTWLSGGWLFPRRGKPIYKHIHYQETGSVNWRDRLETGDCGELKKRRPNCDTVIEFEGQASIRSQDGVFSICHPQNGDLNRPRHDSLLNSLKDVKHV